MDPRALVRLAAVLGGAAGGFDQLASLPPCPVFGVNDAAAEYPGQLAAFVTLHPEKLSMWLDKRRTAGLPELNEVIAHEAHPLVTRVMDYRWPGMNASGSSGLFATKAALEKAERVALCGVPMTAAGTHYTESTFRNDVGGFLGAWEIALPYLRERVRSFSGWTGELLGKPTPEWLVGN